MFSGRKLMQTKAAERHRLASMGDVMRGETGGATGSWEGPKPEPEVAAATRKRKPPMSAGKAWGLVILFAAVFLLVFGAAFGLIWVGFMLPIKLLGLLLG